MASILDIHVTCKSVAVYANNFKEVTATLTGLDFQALLYEVGIKEIISIMGSDDILDEIGESEAVKYFGLDATDE